jgi:hypothetical protein
MLFAVGGLLRSQVKVFSLVEKWYNYDSQYLTMEEVFMSQTLDAVFDGNVFRPDEPIQLEPNTRVRLTIEPATTTAQPRESFLRVARSLNLDGPPDWSSRLDEYLYGETKISDE